MRTIKNNIIVDLDGTLANIEHRLDFLQGSKKDWQSFFKACPKDKPNEDVIDVLALLAKTKSGPVNFHIFSGRNDVVRQETVDWLNKYLPFEYSLVMRMDGDRRPDSVIKKELAREKGLNPSNVLCVFDDRKSVVEMWREEGFTCMQVYDHDF